MRHILRLAVLALGAYGAWKLYEEYGGRFGSARGDLNDFAARAKSSAHTAAEHVSSAAGDATDAIADSGAEIKKAALETQDAVNRDLREPQTVPRTSS